MKRLMVKASDNVYDQLKTNLAGDMLTSYFQTDKAVVEEVYDIDSEALEGLDMQKLRTELKSASADKMAQLTGQSLNQITKEMLEYADGLDGMVSKADGPTKVFVNFSSAGVQIVFSVNRTITRKM